MNLDISFSCVKASHKNASYDHGQLLASKEESVFIKGVAPGTYIMLQLMGPFKLG